MGSGEGEYTDGCGVEEERILAVVGLKSMVASWLAVAIHSLVCEAGGRR
jgi:hypothetical protein